MIVCIAEKPSVARDIARILGANHPQQGFLEGNGYQVTWTFGHLCELKEPHEYTSQWKAWNIWDLPMIPPRFGIKLKEDDGIQKQFAIIEQLMKNADAIINCGDAGQEGELIQRWVMQKAGATCPVQRLWISSMTDEAIREGFQQLKDQSHYESLYIAGLSRAIGDWLLGMNCTRLYTMKYGQNSQVLSIGRVQTPTLALIVRRQQEIDAFVPEPYWILSTVYRDVTFQATKGKFSTKEEGMAFLDRVRHEPFTVGDITSKKGREAPPRLFDLTSLQVECNRKFGYSADLTLRLIQGLYERKLTTYPRVDTTYLSDDIYPRCANILMGIRGYEPFTQPLHGRKLIKSKKVFDSSKVTDHHAIIPTGQPAQNLSDMERNVYDLVTRAFIAVFYPDCQFLSTTVLGRAGDVDFKTSGKQITEPGWRVLYPKTSAPDASTPQSQPLADTDGKEEDTERVLPTFTTGESGPHEPNLIEKQTTPPPYYTEATLLRAMETAGKLVNDDSLRDALKDNGIGRPSTRAAIIETLFKRRYITRERKRIVATATGVELISLIHEELLKSAELTGIWEKKLREIERNQYDAHLFIDELKQMLVQIVDAVRNDHSNRRITIMSDNDLKAQKKRTTNHSTGKAQKRKRDQNDGTAAEKPQIAPPPADGPALMAEPPAASEGAGTETPDERANSAATVGSASNNQAAQYVAGFHPRTTSKKTAPAAATPTTSTSNADAANATDAWIGLRCPVCHQGTIIKGHTAYGCSRWKEGCTYRFPFEGMQTNDPLPSNR